MSRPNDVRDLLAPMADREVDLEGADFRVDRARVVAHMAAVDGRDQRRKRVVVAAGTLGAVCAAAIVLGLWLRPHSAEPRDRDGVGVLRAGAPLEITVSEGHATHTNGAMQADVSPAQSAHLAASGELATGDASRAHVRTPDGLDIELQSRTRVALGQLQAADNQVTLVDGSIRCTIPHRPEAHRFLVVGPAFTVIDVGTVFTVTVDSETHASRVAVEEGEVLIQDERGETRVTAPGTWSPVASAAPSPSPSSTLPVAPGPPRPRKPLSSTPKPATLDAESQLLRRGLAAERQGMFPDAIDALTTLLTKYPDSPLAPDARAALDRVKARARQ